MGGAKHGKVDPDGNPHVGGNQWAGGTGGSDTAGLGGRGGPYRLSDGNAVHQVRGCSKVGGVARLRVCAPVTDGTLYILACTRSSLAVAGDLVITLTLTLITPQVSDEDKAAVSEEALARAREVNRIAYKERLAEIENLDEKGWEMYRGLLERVETSARCLASTLQPYL